MYIIYIIIVLLYLLRYGATKINLTDTNPMTKCTTNEINLNFNDPARGDYQTIIWQRRIHDGKIDPIGNIEVGHTPYVEPKYKHRFQVFENGTLRVKNLQRNDSGLYEREIRNGGTFLSRTNLTVLSPPSNTPYFVRETIYKNDIYSHIVCKPPYYLGYPSASVYLKDSYGKIQTNLSITASGSNFTCCLWGESIELCLPGYVKRCTKYTGEQYASKDNGNLNFIEKTSTDKKSFSEESIVLNVIVLVILVVVAVGVGVVVVSVLILALRRRNKGYTNLPTDTPSDADMMMEAKGVFKFTHGRLRRSAGQNQYYITEPQDRVNRQKRKLVDPYLKIELDGQTIIHAKQGTVAISNMVEWCLIENTETGQNVLAYPIYIVQFLETAFQEKYEKEVFQDTDGRKYVVNFEQMKEFSENDETDAVIVLRRDNSIFPPPLHWTPMENEMEIKVVTLQPEDKAYKEIEALFKSSMGKVSPKIIEIQQIQNKTLFYQYEVKRKQIESLNRQDCVNERKLFHGTALDTIGSINRYGFNRSYFGKHVDEGSQNFGDGVYFAVEASCSAKDAYSPPDKHGRKRMYVCNVITGEFTEGDSEMKVPPYKTCDIVYDSVVDNTEKPKVFVIFNDTQAYPEFLITFKWKKEFNE